jgi:hypothetical protein
MAEKAMGHVMSRLWNGGEKPEQEALNMAKYLCSQHADHFSVGMLASQLDSMKRSNWDEMHRWVSASGK